MGFVLPQRGLLRRPGSEEHTQERTFGWPAEQRGHEGGAEGRPQAEAGPLLP